jgi:multidrug efflux pump subunit AcrB/ABC-type multidrug transport system ATPase subunit
MFFTAIVMMGLVAWQTIPVELLPELSGDRLYVAFYRPGSEPDVVEREILAPLEARVTVLSGVEETWGEIRGSTGSLSIRFEPGANLKTRELELRRIAAELARTQPRGSTVDVENWDSSEFLRGFAMFIQVAGGGDRNALRHLIDERIEQRLLAVPEVSRVVAAGGASMELTVRIDPDRCAAQGVRPDEVVSALTRSVGRLRYMGGLEDASGRTTVVLDGRPHGPVSVGDIGIVPGGAVRVRHVADVELGTGREEMLFRVNGSPSVGLIVYQEEGANLVRLGRALRVRIDELREEFRPYRIHFTISFDGAELVEEQLDRLEKLALTGFLIALAVLYLFLRQWRAVAVVAVAVPISLLAALALLYVSGFSINLVTLFALAVGIGMLVDNSIVVYEAVQRQLERGASPDHAVSEAIRRTMRAIVASSIANGIVFVPIMFLQSESSFLRSLLKVIAVAYLLPLLGSLIVALGLVPLLARKLAAPAAIARLKALRRRRNALAGMAPPDRVRGMFVGLLTVALRRPAGWIASVILAVLLTVVIALPWVGLSALPQESREADEVQLAVELPPGGSLEGATEIFARLERAALDLDGIESVESFVREEGGSLNVKLVDPAGRPADLTAARVRTVVRESAKGLDGVLIESPEQGGDDGSGGDGFASLLGQGSSEIVVSGPEAARLRNLAGEIRARLESMPEIESTSVTGRDGLDEIHVLPDDRALASFGLTADQVLPVLGVVRREGFELQTGFTLADDREIPMTVRRERSLFRSASDLGQLRVATASGVYSLEAFAAVRKMPPPMAIRHHDGRRELGVLYNFNTLAPQSGPARTGLDRRIHDEIRNISRPNGYTVETPAPDEGTGWFKKLVAPVLLLLFAVLAITFESVTLPILILVALPLTVLGSTWALVFSGTPLGPMGLIGALSLIGLTVNPAILLVDRMQHHARIGSLSAGAAALAAVRERARPVLMTTTTAVAGLWPLALVTGRENELWPPFATVVMGGLITSTALTLLVIPVGFVFLKKLDALFGRLGPWILVGWIGATTAVMWPLVSFDLVTSTRWQIITGTLVAALVLGLAVLAFQRPVLREGRAYWRGLEGLPSRPESHAPSRVGGGPPAVEVRSLRKVYGQPGPVRRAWRLPERFAAWVLRRGGQPFDPGDALQRIVPLALVGLGTGYLARWLHAVGWRIIFTFVTAAIVARLLREIRRARGRADQLGRVEPGGPEGVAAVMAPWAAFAFLALSMYVLPRLADRLPEVRAWVPIAIGVVLVVSQLGRTTALRVARGVIPERTNVGRLPRARSLWRSWSRRIFGLDLPRREVVALQGVEFRVERGMVGVLGPNGAGKTTLLRQLAGILEPSLGRITVGGVPLQAIRRYLGRWVGYLPQEFGLPKDLTAREYLEYYALLYEIGPRAERAARITRLIDEVGLTEKADHKIGSYSGGMRQRTAVARTLLRLPEIIIVDEPTVGLDPRERIRFRNLLSKLAEGRIVLFSTHVVEDVAVACERVIVLAGGRLVFDGPPPDLAHTARGSVWEVRVEAGREPPDLPAGARIVDQVPEPDGGTRIRVLHRVQPAPAARPVEPTLEDGYLCLVESRSEAAA